MAGGPCGMTLWVVKLGTSLLRGDTAAMVGDRLFTDVLGGNRLGLFTVLVRPVASDGGPCNRDGFQRLERTVARWLGAPAA